jgi:hypothetical protein
VHRGSVLAVFLVTAPLDSAPNAEEPKEVSSQRTLKLNCQLPASRTGGMLVLAVEMQRGGLVFNMGGNGNNFAATAAISGTAVSCETIVPGISFPCPWQGWRIPIGPSDNPQTVEMAITATIPAEVSLTCQGHFLPK